MKRLIALGALILGLSITAVAQDQSKGMEMTGTVCDQKCVKQDADKAACDTSCTEHSGQAVFLDDSGKLWKVANPASCKGKMGKKVTIHGEKKERWHDVSPRRHPGQCWLTVFVKQQESFNPIEALLHRTSPSTEDREQKEGA